MNKLSKLHSGELYDPGNEDILKQQMLWQAKVDAYNLTMPVEVEKRFKMLKEMFASVGEGCYIEPPFHANFGGRFSHLGKNVYANSNLTLVDDTEISIGDYTMLGPNVVLATAAHPIHPGLRARGYQYNKPIHIGKNCWLGAGVIVLPGITIGDNTIVGAGSVVTKDLPANVLAVGNPCHVLRSIHDEDFIFYDQGNPIPDDLIGLGIPD